MNRAFFFAEERDEGSERDCQALESIKVQDLEHAQIKRLSPPRQIALYVNVYTSTFALFFILAR